MGQSKAGVLSLLALALAACSGAPEGLEDAPAVACSGEERTEVVWRADVAFTPEERADLSAAAGAWSRVSCVVRVSVVFDGGQGPRVITRGGAPSGYVGWTAGDGSHIWLDAADPARFDFGGSARHEFGHALGMHHAEAPGPVMYAHNVRGRNRVTAEDVEACRAAGAC